MGARGTSTQRAARGVQAAGRMLQAEAVARLIDLMHQGRDRVIGAWAIDGVVVDPGPEPCVQTLLAGLGGEPPRTLLLTHIHLDHAGASGALVRRFPSLPVYVHETGAPHLADPSKLLASAERLYGDQMQRLWGEVVPVPEANLRPLRGGEEVEGFRVAHAPGHASHHVAYLDLRGGDAYVGDVAGVRIPPADLVLAPTPPPEIDLDAWERSLDLVAGWSPRSLRLTHFGEVRAVAPHLAAVRESLGRWAEEASAGERDRFLAHVEAVIEAEGPEAADRYRLAVPPEHMWLGLERYWRKRGVFGTGERARLPGGPGR
jgi:glyoxylase-like metal-dependent hydrolase (beta-lactamase superfamily II)